MTTNLTTKLKVLTCLSLLLLTMACSDDDDDNTGTTNRLTLGTAVNIGNGKGYTFIKKKDDGTPDEIGMTFTEASLSGLPDHDQSFILEMPADNTTVIKHVVFDYIADGSDIDGVYKAPHFAIRYYMISQGERTAITPGDPKLDVLPGNDFVPKNYVAKGSEAARGKAWVDTTAPEFNGKPFQSTFIYGSYDGKYIYLGPIIALDFVKTKPNTSSPVALQAKVQQTGLFPKEFHVLWEKGDATYSTTLSALTLQQAQ